MNDYLARQILEIGPGATLDEIKKKYRKLMQLAHPDNQIASGQATRYDASQINAAYTYLINHYQAPKVLGKPNKIPKGMKKATPAYSKTAGKSKVSNESDSDAMSEEEFLRYRQRKASQKATTLWSAPQNPRAYATRDIFQHAEDMDGNRIGSYFVCEGKYYWTKDEDFLLFLQSILQCGKKILDEIDEELNRPQKSDVYAIFQANLIYLLAQQFIDSTNTLKELASEAGKDQTGARYKLAAMLEYTNTEKAAIGEALLPAGVKQHKLYVKNLEEKVLGYISFPDDRLYYVLIPLFEQKLVQVKITVNRKKRTGKYENLDLWVRLPNIVINTLPENLNNQIEDLLNTYRNI